MTSNRVDRQLTFRTGSADETYQGIGKDTVNLDRLPLLADARGAFGSPASDSEWAMIRSETSRIMMTVTSFTREVRMEDYLRDAAELLQSHAEAVCWSEGDL